MRVLNKNTKCDIRDLGLIPYNDAYAAQREFVNDLVCGGRQTLLLCEHPPTLTLGRSSDEGHILVSQEELDARKITVHNIDRGGDVTLHAPGQLVAYPILDLSNFDKDLHAYLHQLEQVAIDLLSEFGILANRFPGKTGAWAGKKKIASIGIGVRKWVSFHGLAVNVNTDLSLFKVIKPCGLDVQMTSVADIKGGAVDMNLAKHKMVEAFSKNFVLDV